MFVRWNINIKNILNDGKKEKNLDYNALALYLYTSKDICVRNMEISAVYAGGLK